MNYVAWILQIIFVPLLAPLAVGFVSKFKAKTQGRRGASILQPYREISKLFKKDEVISSDASWIFRAAPFIVFGVTLVVGASIPLFSTALHGPTSDFLLVAYTLALGTFFLALAGMDTGSAFGGFGSSREMTISAVAEGSLLFSVLPLVIMSGSTNLMSMPVGVAGDFWHHFLALLLAGISFVMVMLAEASRYPFDNPDTHLELTMVHEAMLLEYSGKRLAVMQWAAANKLLIFAALAGSLFIPFGFAQTLQPVDIAVGAGWLAVKVSAVLAVVAVVESLIAKLRFFRLPHLLFIAFILNIVAIGLVI